MLERLVNLSTRYLGARPLKHYKLTQCPYNTIIVSGDGPGDELKHICFFVCFFLNEVAYFYKDPCVLHKLM